MPVDSNSDYYEILGIEKNTSAADIKKAYKKQALQWHPDKNPDNKEEAERRFKLIAEAYEVLSDESKRAVYDRYGKEGLTDGPRRSNGSAHHRFTADDFDHQFNFHFRDPFEMFNDMFGSSMFGDDFFEGLLYQPRVVIRAGRQRDRPNARQRSNPYGSNNQTATFQSFGGFGGLGGFNSPFFSSMMMDDGFGSSGGSSMSFSSSSFGGAGARFKSSSTSTRFVNGKKIVTQTEEEDGKTTVTVTENGKVTSRTVNGTETVQQITYDTGASDHRAGSRENPIDLSQDHYAPRSGRRTHARVSGDPGHTYTTSFSKKFRR